MSNTYAIELYDKIKNAECNVKADYTTQQAMTRKKNMISMLRTCLMIVTFGGNMLFSESR
jgi:hypothetical protein